MKYDTLMAQITSKAYETKTTASASNQKVMQKLHSFYPDGLPCKFVTLGFGTTKTNSATLKSVRVSHRKASCKVVRLLRLCSFCIDFCMLAGALALVA